MIKHIYHPDSTRESYFGWGLIKINKLSQCLNYAVWDLYSSNGKEHSKLVIPFYMNINGSVVVAQTTISASYSSSLKTNITKVCVENVRATMLLLK